MSLCIQMGIVAIARNASKHAAMRAQRTTQRRYFFWNQAKVRSASSRGTTFLIGVVSLVEGRSTAATTGE